MGHPLHCPCGHEASEYEDPDYEIPEGSSISFDRVCGIQIDLNGDSVDHGIVAFFSCMENPQVIVYLRI